MPMKAPRTKASLSLVKVETEEVAQKKDTKEEAKHNVNDFMFSQTYLLLSIRQEIFSNPHSTKTGPNIA